MNMWTYRLFPVWHVPREEYKDATRLGQAIDRVGPMDRCSLRFSRARASLHRPVRYDTPRSSCFWKCGGLWLGRAAAGRRRRRGESRTASAGQGDTPLVNTYASISAPILAAFPGLTPGDLIYTAPPKPDMGDLALRTFEAAKKLGMAPPQLAAAIAPALLTASAGPATCAVVTSGEAFTLDDMPVMRLGTVSEGAP